MSGRNRAGDAPSGRKFFDLARRWLPTGHSLPETAWRGRHRGILLMVWAHVPVLFVFSVVTGESVVHSLFESGLVASWAVLAGLTVRHRTVSTVAATIGMLTASAVLVHLSGGVVEMHFHYFVMVGVVTLYQEWRPFLFAIGYVVLQHGLAGAISPESVYNHPQAVANPWAWAGVHGLFIIGMSVTGIVSWRANELLIAESQRREAGMAEAQHVARLGSWELDRLTGKAEWSDEMYRLLDLDRRITPGPAAFYDRVHPDDRERLQADISRVGRETDLLGTDFRVQLGDGSTRWLHGRWRPARTISSDGVAGTLHDITERIAADQQLHRALSLLHATLDATADGILVVDLVGQIVSCNRQFQTMWRIPDDVLQTGDDRLVLTHVCDQLQDPELFLSKVRDLYADVDTESFDMVSFSDGRIFERHSRPQLVDGEVVGRVWSFRDVTDNKRMEGELAHQAFHDGLTNLPNQALFRDRLQHALARTSRRDASLAVLFVDLDNFKTVNDSLGHPAGDELLVKVTERLLGSVRESDTVARLGGDEFAILLEDIATTDEAADVAGRIIAAATRPVSVAGHELVVSASVGIAFNAADTRVDQLLRNADLAMYTAKRSGKNRFEMFQPEMHATAVERLQLESDLRRAIDAGELVVHYQPVVDITTGTTTVIEALLRWVHPTRGVVPPLSFIPLAEETGLIDHIGRFVLERACRDAAQLRELRTCGDISVSINLSPRQLLGDQIVAQVTHALATSGLPATALILEITEGAMMSDPNRSAVTLQALSDLGIRLAVDDFGTGYSSLSYLARFPIDIVKIDQSFVNDLEGNTDSLVPTIVAMAKALRLRSVAEGVETEGQLDHLRLLGCDLAQGFHLAHPMPLADVADGVVRAAALRVAETNLAASDLGGGEAARR